MPKMPSEAAIRDHLAANLDMIEPGLALVKVEHHLPNASGAAGFLDILAQTPSGQIVIIEIKRTKSAAREALQELHKYAALIRSERALKHTDYRLVLLSVEWDDLLTAYSEHKAHSPYELDAGQIVLGPDGLPTHIRPIAPIAVADEREIARRHFIWHFDDEASARKAIPVIARHMRACGLKDFVLLLLELDRRAHSRFALYFAQQQLSLDVYLALLNARLSPEAMVEFEENIDDLLEEEDKIAEASDAIWLDGEDLVLGPIANTSAEISHPEKASHWFESGLVTNQEVHRFGRFEDSSLTDDRIVAEIVGLGGESDYRLDCSAELSKPPQVNRLLKAIDNVFFFNPVWRGACRDLVDYARKTRARSVRLRAFSNEDILLAVAASAFLYPKYQPMFQFDIERHEGESETLVGMVEWNGKQPNFDHVLAKFFDGDPWAYFMQRHFGTHRSINFDIMAELGLEFGVFRRTDRSVERVRVHGASLAGAVAKPRILFQFVDENVDEVKKIVDMFLEHDQGFHVAIGNHLASGITEAEADLQKLAKGEPRASEKKYWIGDITECDICRRSFRECRFMVDAILGRGVGANVCAVCFKEHGRGLGTGLGQLYRATHKGWLLIAG
jgi:hypothetical protein